MSTPAPVLVKICMSHTNSKLLQYYLCYEDEFCCDQGCCYYNPSNYELFRAWYLWIILLVLFYMFRTAAWCSKSLKMNGDQFNQSDEWTDTDLYENALVELHNVSHKDEPPPAYNLAINYPKPIYCQQDDDIVPNYEQAVNIIETSLNSPAQCL